MVMPMEDDMLIRFFNLYQDINVSGLNKSEQ